MTNGTVTTTTSEPPKVINQGTVPPGGVQNLTTPSAGKAGGDNANSSSSGKPDGGDDATLLGGGVNQNGTQADQQQNVNPNPAEVVPEKYEPWKLPEGMTLMPEIGDKFGSIAKELKLSQDKAQRLIDLAVEMTAKQHEEMGKAFTEIRESWLRDSRKMLGNDAEKSLSYAAKALDKFGNAKLREALNETGFGNHPEMVNFIVNVGKTIAEDNFPEGKPAGVGQKDLASVIYPSKK